MCQNSIKDFNSSSIKQDNQGLCIFTGIINILFQSSQALPAHILLYFIEYVNNEAENMWLKIQLSMSIEVHRLSRRTWEHGHFLSDI